MGKAFRLLFFWKIDLPDTFICDIVTWKFFSLGNIIHVLNLIAVAAVVHLM